MLFFLSNLQQFKDFQSQHSYQDFHFGLEDIDLIYFEAMHRNFSFLRNYLDIKSPIPSIEQLKIKSKRRVC